MKHRNPRSAMCAIAARSLLPLLCCGAMAGPAQADGAVIIYGRISAGIDYQNNIAQPDGGSASLWRAAGNHWGTSMLGFKGSEDLGPGLKAIFNLESGFSTPTGSTNGSALFNRRAWAGLDGSAGTLKLGKNMNVSGDVWHLDPTGQQFIGTATLVRGRNWNSIDNLVEYQTPTWSGLNVTLQTGLGEQPGSFASKRSDGVSVVYAIGALELRGIYTQIRDADARFTSIFDTSKEGTAGATWRVRNLKLFGAYEQLRAPDAAAGSPTRANYYWVGANYDVAPQLTLIGAGFHIGLNEGAGRAKLFMLGTNYILSRRTLLYLSIGNVRNSGNANFSVEVTNNKPLPGHTQSGGYLGIVHTF